MQAVVYDAPVLQYESAKLNDEKLQMVGPVFQRQNYAFALQQDSPLREKLNQALLTMHERGIGIELRKNTSARSKPAFCGTRPRFTAVMHRA